jgi:hypothetical protein
MANRNSGIKMVEFTEQVSVRPSAHTNHTESETIE